MTIPINILLNYTNDFAPEHDRWLDELTQRMLGQKPF